MNMKQETAFGYAEAKVGPMSDTTVPTEEGPDFNRRAGQSLVDSGIGIMVAVIDSEQRSPLQETVSTKKNTICWNTLSKSDFERDQNRGNQQETEKLFQDPQRRYVFTHKNTGNDFVQLLGKKPKRSKRYRSSCDSSSTGCHQFGQSNWNCWTDPRVHTTCTGFGSICRSNLTC